jgi:hypothetical protein
MAKKIIPLFLTLLSLSLIFWAAQQQIKVRVGRSGSEQVSVALPKIVQLFLAGGDRYLAANVNVFRSMMVDTQLMDNSSIYALKKLQLDAAVFNPAHEDNYWIAAATLAWRGEVAAAQTILKQATEARKQDIYPPFFYGFNRKFFYQDITGAAASILVAAKRGSEADETALTAIAARWYGQGEDLALSRSILLEMAKQSKNAALKQYLLQRAVRIDTLSSLRDQARNYQRLTSKKLTSFKQLLELKLIKELPSDPTGTGFIIDTNGIPQFASVQGKK